MGCNRKSYPVAKTAPRLLTPSSIQDWAHLPGLRSMDQHPLRAEYQPRGEQTAHALCKDAPPKQRPTGKGEGHTPENKEEKT